MRNIIWSIILIALVFTACGEDVKEKIEYKDGVVVVNQGAFQSGTGTLTFKGRGETIPVQDIFRLNNNGAFLGNIAQSMIEHDGKNYITINNGGKIVVTHKDDFTLIDTIGSIFQSRYFASDGEKLFVGSWGITGFAGSLVQINAETNKVKNGVIYANGGPEGMVFTGNLLHVCKNGGYGLDSLLLTYDTTEYSIVSSIAVGDNPELIVKDNDSNLYVICNGNTDFSDPSKNTPGRLVKIKDQSIIWSIELPNGSNRLTIDKENGFLYFNMDGNVVKHSIQSEILDTTIVHDGIGFALGFDEVDKRIYIGDAKDFASQGEVFVYDTKEELVESFQCGIVPSYFHFK